jgi:hypothetical protein
MICYAMPESYRKRNFGGRNLSLRAIADARFERLRAVEMCIGLLSESKKHLGLTAMRESRNNRRVH